MGNQVQEKPKTSLQKFNSVITNEKTQEYLSEVLGDKKQSFVSNIVALVTNNEGLQKCEPQTVMYAAIKATALNLPLDQSLGFAYVIPYNKNEFNQQTKQWETVRTEAQFQIGYKGFIQLAQRSGKFKTINSREVREGEIIEEDFITGELIFQRAENREKLPIIGYVAFFELLNGFRKTLYMTKGEVEAHGKKFSKTFKNGPWKTDFDAMAEKTVLKRLITKYAPLSVEMADAAKFDQAVVTEKGPQYIDAEFTTNDIIEQTENEIKAEDIEEVVYPEFDENGELIQ